MGWGIWGSRTSIFPPSTRPFLSSTLCPVASYRVHRTDIHLPCREGNPLLPFPLLAAPSSCPLLKLTLHSFVLRPFLVPWETSFSVCRSRRIVARAFSFFVGPRGEPAREHSRERKHGSERRRFVATSRRTSEESSHETSIAEENTNLILRVIHLGRHRSGLSPVICIFTSICFVLIVRAPARLCTLLQRRK